MLTICTSITILKWFSVSGLNGIKLSGKELEKKELPHWPIF